MGGESFHAVSCHSIVGREQDHYDMKYSIMGGQGSHDMGGHVTSNSIVMGTKIRRAWHGARAQLSGKKRICEGVRT